MRSVVETKEKEIISGCFVLLFSLQVLRGYIRDGDLEVIPVKAFVCVLLHSGCAGGYGCLGALQSLW